MKISFKTLENTFLSVLTKRLFVPEAAILSGGKTSKNIGDHPIETDLSQVFISVDVERHLSKEQLNSIIEDSLSFMSEKNKSALYPGQRSLASRKFHLQNGIDIPHKIWSEITKL